MKIIDIIEKKKKGLELSKEEISFAVNGYLKEEVKDYQMSALLMAIWFNSMTDSEIFDLTEVMLNSGNKIDLSSIEGIKVDKHSSGGVGDKTTLVLAPLVASCGVKMAKMSGRGLGHTGGTIDKLEAIEGFNVALTEKEFIDNVNKIGLALTGQTGNVAPADKKIYALRDVTGTVDSIPLIASSIMSKKLASGANKLVIDLKLGSGALVKTLDEADRLGNLMVKIGKNFGLDTACFVTNMNEPLGKSIGNGLEVMEAIECLKGQGPDDLRELIIKLGTYLVSLGKNISEEKAEKEVTDNLDNGKAYSKFLEFVKLQGGNIDKISIAPKVFSVKSNKGGFIADIDALKLGKLARNIGAGRFNKEDKIDYGVGFVLNKKVGDFVLENEELIKVYLNEKDIAINDVLSCFKIENDFKEKEPLIYKVIK